MDQIPATPLPLDWAIQAPSGADLNKDPARLKAAAVQFEALLVGQLLRGMREAGGGGWLGADQQSPASSMVELAEQHLALMLAGQGGLGLARFVQDGLAAAGHETDAAAPAGG